MLFSDLSARIGVSQHSLYKWIKAYAVPAPERQLQSSQTEELRRLKAEVKRVTEERDILKKDPPHLSNHSPFRPPSSSPLLLALSFAARTSLVQPGPFSTV